jgi:glucosamine-6-phosphate deaminase
MSSPVPQRAFTVDRLKVEIHPTAAAMGAAAAAQVATHLRALLAAQKEVAAIFASATSQIQFLDALVAAGDIDWSRVTLFHMDEYLGISAGHPASFRRFMRERMESRLPLRAFHYLAGDAPEPLRECRRYAGLLAQQPPDFCCLGIGENGHIAFNDPPVADFEDPDPVKLVRLDARCRRQQVGEGCFPSLDQVPQYAYTLSIPALLRPKRLFCIVPDERKADAVRDTLRGPIAPACPASILRRHPDATLFLDAPAARRL